MGWTGGDEREEGHGGVRGEAEDETAVGEVSSGCRRSEGGVVVGEEGPGGGAEGEEGLGFVAAGLPVGDGSMAKKTHQTTNQSNIKL